MGNGGLEVENRKYQEMDKKALAIVTYWLKKKIGALPLFEASIMWRGEMFGDLFYLIRTNLEDGALYLLQYERLREIWYLEVYQKSDSDKYMGITVDAEIIRKVDL